MPENKEITIRTVKVSDVKNLASFFVKAYGDQTVFQNEEFLLYYFDARTEKLAPFSANLIALSPEGEIVSHYGGLYNNFKIDKKIIPVIWGVNAYTLPEWRGKGINSRLVEILHRDNEANAAMGMDAESPFFYKKLGYNIFNRDTLNRFVYVLDAKTFDVVNEIGQNIKRAKELLVIGESKKPVDGSENVVELTKKNFHQFDLDLDIDLIATTYRDIDFLDWRLFRNPYIEYKIYGYVKNNTIITYVALRDEILEPNKFKVSRIIDLFGKNEGVMILLNHIINRSFSNGHIYIDFSMYGRLYEAELESSGFSKLENDDACILPQVTTPIENRPNGEFIVIQSKVHDKLIQSLSKENVYFTRIDGDRDRIARISQIN